MNGILLTTTLLIAAFACTTPESSMEIEKGVGEQVISNTPSDEIYIPTFKIYGELAPSDYLDGRPDEISLTTAHGFMVIRVSGCNITPDLMQSVKSNNREANDYMIKLHGENWRSEFEDETGKNFSFPS
ncbi:MAG: hypothetical protein ACI837_001461 [Crocinitomicaceae bacterium]|jgi:hypothetical protein